MADYRDEILSLRHQSHADQFGLMDLFRFGSNTQIKQGLLAFGKALVHDKGVCFYIDYDVSSVAWSELEGFSEAIDELVSLLHRDFLQQQDRADYDVWGNDTFRIIWLLSIIWFRKLFHEFKSATI